MPELPEVETIRRGLEPFLTGRTIQGARFLWHRTAHGLDPEEMARRLTGQKVVRLDRRGKFLLIRFESGAGLGVHLRMTGRLRVMEMDDLADDTALRATFDLDNGTQLRFSDSRKFGRVYWLPAGDDSLVEGLGPEPLDGLTLEHFGSIVRRNRQIKSILLDQSRIAGIGNIYADESLYAAKIHPARRGCDLSDAEVARLYSALRSILERSISLRGTSYRDYVDSLGRKGSFQEELAVYGKKGRHCPRCGAEINREVVANRGTHYCPGCQKLHVEPPG